MRFSLLAVPMIALSSIPAPAATLEFTDQELVILSEALNKMPYGTVANLIASLQRQLRPPAAATSGQPNADDASRKKAIEDAKAAAERGEMKNPKP